MTTGDEAEALAKALEPCPFCGGKPRFISQHDKGPTFNGACIDCPTCEAACVDRLTDAEAIAAWNRRTRPADGEREKAIMEAAAKCLWLCRDYYAHARAPYEDCANAILALLTPPREQGEAANG